MRMPAVSLAAVKGRRQRTLEVAAEIEQRGFSGIYCPSMGDCVALCQGIAHVTNEITFGTSVHPIYLREPSDLATTAAFIHEIAEGRFRLGLGVTHGPVHQRLGITPGKPLSDMRNYVEQLRAAAEPHGDLPPIILATLRRKMVELSVDISDGAVWANASLNHFAASVADIPAEAKNEGFFIGNMIPTVISDDRDEAGNRNRKTLSGYVALPNYRNYWKQAGWEEEMNAVEVALENKDQQALFAAMTDDWLSNATLYGSAGEVRDGVEAWFDAGCDHPILVPSSVNGGQMRAIDELFDAFS